MAKKEILIFGAGGHASKLVEIIEANHQFKIAGYISTEEKGTIINNYPVIGDIIDYNKNVDLKAKYYHIAIGENSVRYQIYQTIRSDKSRLVKLISSNAVVSPEAYVGNGTAVIHNAVIWNNVKIGVCGIIDTGAIIEHDTIIGDFVNISPGAVICGSSKIGDEAIIGAGATVIEKVSIGKNTLVGAGSVVINDIEPNVVVVGNSARVIKKRDFYNTFLR